MRISVPHLSVSLLAGAGMVLGAKLTVAALTSEPVSGQFEVPNFALLDQEGRFHELDYYAGMEGVKGIVLFVQGNGCPLVRKRVPELKRLREAYESRGILFGMINANSQDERAEIVAEAEAYGIDMPVLVDEAQVVAQALGLERTGEALLISASSKAIIYRGAIDDRLTYQKEKPEAEARYLEDALNAFLEGKPVSEPRTEAPGCKIALPPDPAEMAIRYADQVVPILKRRCVTCHTKGGIGPFALSNYKKVRGWSSMIEEVLMTQQMPPWHADPHVGAFANDAGLTVQERRTLISWIRNDSPRGEGEDGLEGYRPEQKTWKLGPPDHVIKLPVQTVPAEGVLDYRYVEIDSPFEEDVWLRASEVNPGNPQVLHHLIATSHPKGEADSKRRRRGERWICGYAPGTEAEWLPEGTGILLPKGHRLRFQLHYTVSGKEETDATQLGLYLAKTPPDKPFKIDVVAHHRFKIQPHAREHAEEYVHPVKTDRLLYAMNPHMHFRGKRMSFTLRRADGTEEPLLSVPNYNFNWQRTYRFAEPLAIPAGSEIVIRNAWDNSALNPHNPDPGKTVTWGEQSFEEMFFATMNFVEVD